ncbi:YidH family protein [Iningainema tapete]|uniref:DUF202 domain-containing protein n=1 Tax=Iningainema tapete BLCC-T55 TaxID=2748662 RepID=A0A8J6XG12_9CYAN|nr:DUF202 domain-containing protein [Iningainema tapete]MBD2775134.1 DUF202 domain-containing protein [Iningainema tapete BLCC-T55]
MSKMPKIDRQREHQANERTFLAWLRTSVSLIAFGFAIARFGLFLRQLSVTLIQYQPSVNPILNSQYLGIGLVIFGLITIGLAAWRYNQVFWQIESGDYQPTRWTVWVMTGAVMLFGILSMPLLMLQDQVNPTKYQSSSQSKSRNFR